MSAGSIPVFVGRDIVRPYDEEFDWDKISFVFTPDEVGPGMIETLRAVPQETLKEMQVNLKHQNSCTIYFCLFVSICFLAISGNVCERSPLYLVQQFVGWQNRAAILLLL